MQFIKNFFNYVKSYSKYVDFLILIAYVALSLIGLVMIYSASMVSAQMQFGNAENFYTKQLLIIILGFSLVFFMTYFMSGNFFKMKGVQLIMLVSIIFLLLFTMFFGSEINGQRNWIDLGFFNLQSSEFFKIIAILYLAYIYNKREKRIDSDDITSIIPLAFILIVSGMVMLHDFGTWLVIAAMIIGTFLYIRIPVKAILWTGVLVGGVGTAIAGITFLVKGSILNEYQLNRIETFFHPFNDPMGTGYQLTNSLIAISHGGMFGTGIGNGIIKLGYLPEPHTDFIMAVIAEELGLIGVLFIILLYLVIILKALSYAHRSTDTFYRIVCIGVAMYITMQVFINVGGISKIIPLTGVPLPLLSYGGSSFLSVSIAIGLLIIAAKHVKQKEIELKKQR
ncbi:cell division protein FtsW [Jeotgalicoccus coquinae]|uniref:Probable peptidoglycan glycosyltransferase FtsW n=1 Tax=Jeotgalicoccus coquinae TaxID=709509 RepID=A0A6V7RKJ8_9STAP|nr:FtsW/RodA/SpoVE family cell cycle protein [Jeotgalicoccus coquinae]MBB6422507.1 cell division protein FtsW [Jeotgalicoccus coquinae]GGE15339.1 cell division protein FtsW [Jeotgalicoccus coquinae]CAD2078336.1 Lipid II flippase FtsW [Jeotgalicoccus coquinae]